ncbi:MAG: sodium:glutamate symporter, partial [Oscillatoriales cyanobacterium]
MLPLPCGSLASQLLTVTSAGSAFDLKDAMFAYTIIAIFLLVGRAIRQNISILKKLYIPSSIVAGAIALALGPEILGRVVNEVSPVAEIGVFSAPIRTVWKQSPGVFINVVFAALFLGETIPSPRNIWQKAAPQVAFGQILAWGQYVVGMLVTIAVLVPLFHLSPLAGALIEVAFEGGHGTAAGMADTFTKLGFPEGGDLALGLATVGIVSGIVCGIILANWGRRKGYVAAHLKSQANLAIGEAAAIESQIESPAAPTHHQEHPDTIATRARLNRDLLIDPISLNVGFVGLAIAIGWVLLYLLAQLEALTWGRTGLVIAEYVPLFPMALIGGIVLQIIMVRLRLDPLIERPLMERIAGIALDATIVTALASLSLAAISSNLAPFVVLSIVGIVWNVFVFVVLAPRVLPSYWFERGICDLGQSMGVTATGILLLRMVDPENESGAFESFAYKQLFFEPIVGGGLFTAAAPALIDRLGAWGMLALTTGLLVFWLIFGLFNFRQTVQAAM